MDTALDERFLPLDPNDQLNSQRWTRRPKGQGAKGKQVHICSELHAGEICGKVYSRAEHLRRHHARHHSASASRRQSLSSSATDGDSDPSFSGLEQRSDFNEGANNSSSNSYGEPGSTHITQWITHSTAAYKASTKRLHTPTGHGIRDGPLRPCVGQGHGLNSEDQMNLMFHWIEAYKQMFDMVDPAAERLDRSFYLEYTPQLCSADEHVRDLILSIASSHMQLHRPRSLSQQHAADQSYHKALVNHRNKISQLVSGSGGRWTDTEVETAVFMTYLLTIRTIVNTQHVEKTASSMELFNQLLLRQHLLKGFNSVYGVSFPRIKSRPFTTLVLDFYKDQAGCHSNPPNPILDPPVQHSRQHFPSLIEEIHRAKLSEEAYHGCICAVHLTDWILDGVDEHLSANVTQARWMLLNAFLPRPFIVMLQDRDPLAMVIYAHVLCLETTAGISQIWWISGDIRARVNALRALTPPQWHWALEWPLGVANGEYKIC